jgi:sugar lactone lactonase YvrE
MTVMPRHLVARPVVDARAELAESPRWDDRTQRLLWVDILRGELHAFDPARGSDELLLRAGRHLGAVAPRADGGFALAVREGLANPDVPFLADAPGLRTNDARPDRAGRLWFGVIAYDADHGPTAGRGLFRLDADGALTEVVPGALQANGLDWSPDDATLYFADTLRHVVLAFPYDAATGALGDPAPFLDLAADRLLPDGLAVDADGGVWIGLYGAGAVHRYTPDGTLDVVVRIPGASNVTSPAFGGPGLRTLFVTTALEGLDAAGWAAQPNAGALFALGDTGHAGQPTTRFGDGARPTGRSL